MSNPVNVNFITKVVEVEVNDTQKESLAAAAAIASAGKATEQASAAAVSAAVATDSANDAGTTAKALMNFLADKETLPAPAIDTTLSVSGAGADAKITGDIRKMLADSSVSGNSFSMLANTSHSSTIDQAYVDIPAGEEFYVWAKITPVKNGGVWAYYADGTFEQIMSTETSTNPRYAGGRLKLLTASKRIARIGVNIVTPTSDTECEFVILSKTTVPIIKNELLAKDCYVYFASSSRPTFKTTLNSTERITGVEVTFPNIEFRIYSGYNNTLVYSTSTYNNQTFTVGTLEKLVFDWSDNTIKVLSSTFTEGGPYLLLLEVGGSVNGALSCYYYASNIIKADNHAKLQIYSPSDVYIEQDTTNLKVYIKTNSMYVRPFPTISHTWSQFLTEIEETGVTSPKGVENCLCLESLKVLIFNYSTNLFAIKGRGFCVPEDIVVLAQNNGILYYIYPTLINAGMNKEYFDKLVNPKYMEYYSNQLKYTKNVDKNSDFTFLFFSDIHGGATNMNRIVEFANLTKTTLDCIINGGDTVENKLEDGLTWYNDAVDNCDVDILVCAGNHDEWTGSPLSPVAKIDTYNALFAPMVLKVTGIVQPADASTNGDMYYYKDYASKIRVIVIDANDGSGINHFDSAQATWFANVLEDARTNNLEVLCVNHSPYGKNDAGLVRDDNLCWNSWRSYSQMDNQKITEGALTAVDTFINNGGTFIGWITGHTHMDNILTNTNHPGQFMFSTATALYYAHSIDGAGGASSNPVTSGQYDCFNFMGVDTTNHLLKWWRIGYSIDGGLKERNVFCYDYANKIIVSDK